MLLWLWILIGLGILLVAIAIYYFNKFVVLENRIKNSLAQIDVQLKKRVDLIPALVKVVKGYAKHEKDIFTQITKARTDLVNGKDIQQKVKAGDALQGVLGKLFAIAESNPELKANQNYLHLQTELSAIEDKVAYARQYYNDGVLFLDNASQSFPGVMFFRLYGRENKDYLKIPSASREMPKIDL